MARLGMDVDVVEQNASKLKGKGEEIDHIISSLEGLVGEIHGAWDGKDSNEFSNSEWPRYRKQLQTISQQLKAFGDLARRNADRQRTESSHL